MVLDRIYNNQQEAFKAINNNCFQSGEERKRLNFIKANLDKIIRINGIEVNKVNLIGNNLEYYPYCRPIVYLDIEFKD